VTKAKGEWAIPAHWPVRDARQYRPMSWFVPYDNNPRTHPPEEIALLAELLKKHGPDQPIVVDERREILKGHGRRLAAYAGGLEHFTFVQRKGLPEEEKTAMRIADNAVALLAGWDRALIYEQIASLKTAGYDVNLLGFGQTQLVQFSTLPGPPGSFQEFGPGIATDFECPNCGHAWSGKPKPGSSGDRPPKAPKR
jgi:ParB family transcriptional regulator, chromosome partitioning protein